MNGSDRSSGLFPKWLIVPFSLGLILRSFFLWYWETHNLELMFGHDSYVQLAQQWLGWISDLPPYEVFTPAPVFTLVCAFLMKLTGAPHLFLIRTMNVLFSASTIVVVGLWALRISDFPTARLAAFFVALNPTLIFFSPHLQSEPLFVLLEMTFFYFLARQWNRFSKGSAFGLGFLGGIVTLTRSVFINFLPFLFAILLTDRRQRRGMTLVLLVLGWGAPISIWALRNWITYHQFIPLTVNTGTALYLGLTSTAEEHRQKMIETAAEEKEAGLENWIQVDKWRTRKWFDFVKAYPGQYARILGGRLVKFWRPWPYPPYPFLLRVGMGVLYSVVFLFAAMGAWKMRTSSAIFPVYAFFISTTLTHTILDASLRYRVPLEPLLCFFASVGVIGLLQKFDSRTSHN